MPTTTPNMALQIPVIGDTDYPTSVSTTFNNIDTHTHNGTNSLQIAATSLTGLNNFFAEYQSTTVSSFSGSSGVVTTSFSGKTPGGGASLAGVITTAPNNRVEVRDQAQDTSLSDAAGNLVYGRITESSSVWTLSLFSIIGGSETAYTLSPGQNLTIYFREVFNLATRPTIPTTVVGGSGGGGGGRYVTTTVESIGSGGAISSSLNVGLQYRRVQGNGGPQTTSTTPFGASGGWGDGTVITLKGDSDANSLTIPYSDTAKGALLNGDAELTLGRTLTLIYDSIADRWIELWRNF